MAYHLLHHNKVRKLHQESISVFKSILATAIALFFPLAVLAQQPTTADSKAAAERAQAVLQQAREALGGEAKLKAIQSLTANGDYKGVGGQGVTSGKIKFDLLLPDKYLKSVTLSPSQMMQVTTLEAVNGADVWTDRKMNSGTLGGGDFGGGGMGGGGMGGGGGVGGGADAGGGGMGGGGMGGGRGGGRGGGMGGGGMGGGGGGRPGGGMSRMPELDPQMQALMQERTRAEYARLTTSWLLSAPSALPLEFNYDRELDTKEGKADAVRVTGANDFVMWLIFDRATHRPAMLTYREVARGRRPSTDAEEAAREPQMIDIQLYLTDYKQVNDVWLPHQIVKASSGRMLEEWKLKYKLNPNLKPKQFEKPKKN